MSAIHTWNRPASALYRGITCGGFAGLSDEVLAKLGGLFDAIDSDVGQGPVVVQAPLHRL